MPITSRFAAAAARAYGMFSNLARAVDPFFNYVTALLHGDGTNGAQNNTFLDSSTNNFTITRNGNTTQGTFSPFSQTGWSNYFDGSSYIQSSANSALAFSGDFTVETWFYYTGTYTNLTPSILTNSGTGGISAFEIGNGTNFVEISGISATDTVNRTAFTGGAMNPNQWYHLAIVRSSGTIKAYINGTALGTTISNSVATGQIVQVGTGRTAGAGFLFVGYLSNYRMVSSAVYTSNFTPSTTPLTAISGTQMLTCQSNRFYDASSNALTYTTSGSPSVQAFSPFNPTSAWSASSNGGSGYFDGSGDYLQNTSVTNQFDVGSAFTLEMWAYVTTYGFDGGWFNVGGSTVNWNATTGLYISLYYYSNNLYWQTGNGSGSAISMITTAAPPANSWCHVAIGYNGTTTRMWINGTSVGTSTSAYAKPSGTDRFQVGAFTGGGSPYSGYLSNVRFVKGTDVYGVGNTSITVPTAPLTAITNTSLLLSYTNAGIYDNAAVGDYETVGNAQVSTSVFKYGTGSMYFDGTGDWLTAPAQQAFSFGSGDWTVEFWLYTAQTTEALLVANRSSGGGATNTNWYIYKAATTNQITLYVSDGSAWQISGITGGPSVSNSTWYHIAVCRIGSTFKIYVNGTQTATGTWSGAISSTLRPLMVGSDYAGSTALNGYIDDLRITKGVGRYPYNFTPPTAAFPNIGGTVTLTADPYFRNTTLLLPGNGTNGAQNNTFLDSSSNAFTITRNGNTTQGNFSPFSQTGWSNYFDGSGDYLITTSTQVIPTGSFTVEAFVYPTSSSDSYAVAQGTTGNAGRFSLGITSSLWYVQIGAAQVNAGSVALNQWTHLAATFNGTTLTLYVNGTSVGTAATTTNAQNTTLRIGSLGPADWGAFYWTGYISNTRSTNSVVYTSNFTPPTSALTAISGTTFLSCQSNRFIDNSTNAYAITRNGDVSVQAFSPFAPTAAWSASTNGGSGYFDGSGDYLTVPDNAAFDFGSGDFTISAWVYPQGAGAIIDQGGGGASSNRSFEIYMSSASAISNAYISSDGNYNASYNLTGTTVPNAWNFVEFTRSSGTIRLFVNGTLQSSAAANITIFNSTATVAIGNTSQNTVNPFTGYIADVRVLKGTGSASSTVPTVPLTAITNTQLLLSATNGGIVDATAKNDLETVGNAQISTTQSKFGGSSMYFDGTGDGLRQTVAPLWSFGTADFTIEAWVYPTAFAAGSSVIACQNQTNASAGLSIAFALNASGQPLVLAAASTGGYAVNFTGTALSLNTWTHVAVTRYGNTFTIWQNGVSTATASSSVSITQDSTAGGYGGWNIGYSPITGQTLTGYIDDFRFTKNIARYTSNFTPPTSAFLLQ